MKENNKDNKCRGKLIIISGPSGAGKSTLIEDALKDMKGYVKSVSVTTRPRRKNEKEGIKYNFISRKEFEKLVDEHCLMESATYCDFQYGTPLAFVEEKMKAGLNVILEIEVQGAIQVREKIKNVFMIFIVPSNVKQLENRLKKRNTEHLTDIEKRMKTAVKELKYQFLYDCIIVNNDYNEALQNLKHVLNTLKEC
jgi:guanylate kinase